MLRSLIASMSIIPVAFCLTQAQDVTGDWMGTVSMPAGDLRLSLHISKAGNELKATLDSVDQGVNGIPVESIQVEGSKLTFTISRPPISFDGQVDDKAAAIEGMLTGGAGSAPFTLRRGAVAKAQHKPAKPSDIDGDWKGAISAGPERVELTMHIMNTEDGLVATLDQPSQNVQGAEASSVTRTGSSVVMEWKVFGSRFEGTIAENRSAIEGNVLQAGNSIPLVLKREKP